MDKGAVNILLDRKELAKLDRLTKEMERSTNYEMPIVARNVARDFCYIAQRYTPSAPKNAVATRPIIDQKGRKRYIKAKGKVVRGLAKGGWSHALTKLGVDRSKAKRNKKLIATGGSGWAEKHGGIYKGSTTPTSIFLLVGNKVPFIEDLDNGNYIKGKPAHIMQKTLRRLNVTMERRLSKMATRILKRGFI